MRQGIILVILIVGLVFLLLATGFRQKKEREYKNDERWQEIKQKADQNIFRFFNGLTMLVFLGLTYFNLAGDFSIKLTLVRVFQYAFYVLLLRYVVDYCSLKYYDRNM